MIHAGQALAKSGGPDVVACLQDGPPYDLRDALCALQTASERQVIDEQAVWRLIPDCFGSGFTFHLLIQLARYARAPL